ncbi:MAG: MOSC domain-containing protein, partial [Methylococcales bacterium]|nr:MOSC domain-containing protein [Methylococcales bacterium]
IAALAGTDAVKPAQLRRNFLISGINLLALEGRQFRLGDEVVLEMTDGCRPCHKMEALLGPGGYNAMTGLGGITCKVIQEGEIKVGDKLVVLS